MTLEKLEEELKKIKKRIKEIEKALKEKDLILDVVIEHIHLNV